ncbi:SDR family oxidoreductase [Svornostia abyssi]|uniref:SDR family oxidoreductase n=1 Tax=Svornostia abyssi TaxID=2898438 RepID=A0ABY5PN79_9ACTN|nr:SDR family oxidoreductase [Parviterribacteraceae bacterium J379]
MGLETLNGQRVFITGAASGIGRATALAAAKDGAILFLTDIQDVALEKTARDIEAAGGTVAHRRALDIADYDAVVALADEIHAEHGTMDLVMNVAGISTWGAVEHLRHEDWRRTIEIDLMGPIHVIEAFIPPMIEAGRGGHLVNVSSAAGLFGLPWHAPYSAAKFGLRGVSEVLRFDLRRHGIGVTLVCPGGVDTPLVGTVDIVGVDRDHPEIKKFTDRFQKHAVPPEVVAEKMLTGVRKGKYLVFTSRDIQVGYWFQRKFALPYELAMRLANRKLVSVARRGMLPKEPG